MYVTANSLITSKSLNKNGNSPDTSRRQSAALIIIRVRVGSVGSRYPLPNLFDYFNENQLVDFLDMAWFGSIAFIDSYTNYKARQTYV